MANFFVPDTDTSTMQTLWVWLLPLWRNWPPNVPIFTKKKQNNSHYAVHGHQWYQ